MMDESHDAGKGGYVLCLFQVVVRLLREWHVPTKAKKIAIIVMDRWHIGKAYLRYELISPETRLPEDLIRGSLVKNFQRPSGKMAMHDCVGPADLPEVNEQDPGNGGHS